MSEQLHSFEIIFDRVLKLASEVSETNAKTLSLITALDSKTPNKKQIDEILELLGKSDRSIISLLTELKDSLDNIKKSTTAIDSSLTIINKINIIEGNVKSMKDFLDRLSNRNYTSNDVANLGNFASNSEEIVNFVRTLKKWGFVLIILWTFLLGTLSVVANVTGIGAFIQNLLK